MHILIIIVVMILWVTRSFYTKRMFLHLSNRFLMFGMKCFDYNELMKENPNKLGDRGGGLCQYWNAVDLLVICQESMCVS